MKTQIKTNLFRNLILAGLVAVSLVSAQETEIKPEKRGTQEIGVRYSNLTGYGVGYQVNFLTHYYARGTAWFKYYEYIKGEPTDPFIKKSNKIYNFGLDLQRNIISESKYRVFSMIGGGYAIKEQVSKYKDELTPNPNNIDRRLITAGAGGGIEYYFSRNVSMDLGVTYKFDYLLNRDVLLPVELQTADKMTTDETTKETGLGLNIGLNLVF